ncbi:zinc finger protein 652-like [Diabrotica virgifera virgifera]|uniref:Zinc finger protein 652-like n=1 Tax=Diabrotica virgifera virgifera TaxID=50390 RepID=A0A6P7GER4_DIAVI|nr:zinc finger protein 652-like [Diabrotica virgifera virgifera]
MPRISSNGKIPLKEKLYQMYINGEHRDIEILLQDGVTKAHCLILAAESPVIYKMVEHQTTDLKTIDLRQFSKLTMMWILKYLYKGDFMCPVEDLTDFKEAAEFLQLEGFRSSVKEEPSNSPKIFLQAPIIVISDDSDSSPTKIKTEETTNPRKRLKNSTRSRSASVEDCNHSKEENSFDFLDMAVNNNSEITDNKARTQSISDKGCYSTSSSDSDTELEDSSSPDFCLRVSKKNWTTPDKNKKGESSKERKEELLKLIKSEPNEVFNIPDSTSPDESIVLIENPPSSIEISDEESEAEKRRPPNIEEESHPPKSYKVPNKVKNKVWTSKHTLKKLGRTFCAICNKKQRSIKTHIKLNHRHIPRKAYFYCKKCYKKFYYESVLKNHKEIDCESE